MKLRIEIMPIDNPHFNWRILILKVLSEALQNMEDVEEFTLVFDGLDPFIMKWTREAAKT